MTFEALQVLRLVLAFTTFVDNVTMNSLNVSCQIELTLIENTTLVTIEQFIFMVILDMNFKFIEHTSFEIAFPTFVRFDMYSSDVHV